MKQSTKEDALRILRQDEGERRHAYDDSTGKRVRGPVGNLTIGIGTNLERGLSDYAMDMLARHTLHEECLVLEREASSLVPPVVVVNLPEEAQLGLALAVYQLGAERLMEFHRMLAAIARGDWLGAAAEAMDSDWARETDVRARRVADLFRRCVRPAPR